STATRSCAPCSRRSASSMSPSRPPTATSRWCMGAGPRAAATAALPALLLILCGLVAMSSTGRDDTHITYWAAHALRETGRIVNYNGDPVEQSSTLLFTLLLAGVNLVTGIDFPLLGGLLGLLFGVLAVITAGRVA